jgi:two-component system NtrC family sensor kinase
MATIKKKSVKKSKAKPRRTAPKKSQAKPAQTVQSLRRELADALEQRAATSDILRMIARAPADLQSVLDSIAENAGRLCDANDALVHRVEGDSIHLGAHFGSMPAVGGPGRSLVFDRGSVPGRAIIDQQTIHVPDLPAAVIEFPQSEGRGIKLGVRTALATPLMRDGVPLGVIHIRRTEVRPFSDNQIKLLETFADQAVIAIENARLFQEREVRNRELAEALEQQTATAEILGVIASSPTDLKPVLETITERAARVCGAEDAVMRLVEGNVMRLAAHYGPVPDVAVERPLNRQSPPGRAVLDREVVHVENIQLVIATEYPEIVETNRRVGGRTVLAVPLMREEVALGVIHFRRLEVRPFSEKQIAQLKSFADQAVIAIENVRLFQELQARNRDLTESLEQQTATSEILGVIASSPTDLTPVLATVAKNAAHLCEASSAQVFRFDGNVMRLAANYGELAASEERPVSRGTVTGRAIVDRKTIHVHDLDKSAAEFPESKAGRHQARLATPLLREGVALGVIGIRRTDLRPFTQSQIRLLETFADQAVIAIENVRLFRELTEALEQ